MKPVFAAYRGDEFVDVGTAEELSPRLGISAKNIRWRSCPCYRKRSKGKKGIEIIRIGTGE